MPYISDDKRRLLDADINILSARFALIDEEQFEGALNYTVSRLIASAVYAHYAPKYRWKYFKINMIVGVLECVKQEFYRRVASNYEMTAQAVNGDIPEYSI